MILAAENTVELRGSVAKVSCDVIAVVPTKLQN